MNLEKVLENYGLTEKQAKIYLACLELGSASVQKISRKAGIARSTCYEILESINLLGLVSKFQKKKIINFNAEAPRQLIRLTQNKASLLEEVLPEFDARYGEARVRPTVRFYEGKTGMKLILEEILQDNPKEVFTFGAAEDLFATLDRDFPEFVKRRIKHKILARVILRDSEKARERQRLGQQELREVRIIPARHEYHGSVFVWAKKIAMFSYKPDLVALVIESDELARLQRIMFELVWTKVS
jgi:sugar-specific transcriptional regulator TrmB